MDKDVETDASAELGAIGGSVPGPSRSGPISTNSQITYNAPDGSKFVVRTTGHPPNLQVGTNNVMHVYDKALFMGSRKPKKQNLKPKLPVLKSTDVPGAEAMDIVARHIGKDWKALGRNLGLTDGELDNIKIDYYVEGQYEVTYQMIRKWKELAYPTELCKLAKCCVNIGRGDVADKLAEAHTDQ